MYTSTRGLLYTAEGTPEFGWVHADSSSDAAVLISTVVRDAHMSCSRCKRSLPPGQPDAALCRRCEKRGAGPEAAVQSVAETVTPPTTAVAAAPGAARVQGVSVPQLPPAKSVPPAAAAPVAAPVPAAPPATAPAPVAAATAPLLAAAPAAALAPAAGAAAPVVQASRPAPGPESPSPPADKGDRKRRMKQGQAARRIQRRMGDSAAPGLSSPEGATSPIAGSHAIAAEQGTVAVAVPASTAPPAAVPPPPAPAAPAPAPPPRPAAPGPPPPKARAPPPKARAPLPTSPARGLAAAPARPTAPARPAAPGASNRVDPHRCSDCGHIFASRQAKIAHQMLSGSPYGTVWPPEPSWPDASPHGLSGTDPASDAATAALLALSAPASPHAPKHGVRVLRSMLEIAMAMPLLLAEAVTAIDLEGNLLPSSPSCTIDMLQVRSTPRARQPRRRARRARASPAARAPLSRRAHPSAARVGRSTCRPPTS